MLLRVGQDLTKLLTPDPAFSASMSYASSAVDDSTIGRRPSSAQWRAMSSVNKSQSANSLSHHRSTASAFPQPGHLSPSNNHRKAKDNAIGLRSTEEEVHRPPHVPPTIRDPQGTAALVVKHHHMLGGNASVGESTVHDNGTFASLSSGNSFTIGTGSEQEEVHRMIAERERRFFQEISRNPQLRDQHPLMHLISAQQKLAMVDKQSGVLTSKAANKKESFFGAGKYGNTTFPPTT